MNAKELSVEETKKALVLRDLVMSGKADLKAARAATGLARMAYDWTRFGHRLERE